MALETLAALSLAGNIVQFIDFGCGLFVKSQELYGSATGLAAEDAQLAIIARSLRRLSQNLEVTSSSASEESSEASDMEALVDECKRVASDLLGALDQLKPTSTRNKWRCFRDSLKRVWKAEKIDNLARRLDSCSIQLTACLLKLLSDKQSSVILSLKLLSEAYSQSQSEIDSRIETLRQSSVSILKKLENLHIDQANEVRQNEQRHQAKATQLKQLSLTLCSMVQTGERMATEYHILESLLYKRMEIRHARIADAHAQTFEWIFNQSSQLDEPLLQTNPFIEWLTSGRGIFWVTGKAGSGKSTLMKFLSRHRKTKEALRPWAGDKKLVIASFYFWSAGSELQKSQEGLLQSLLHEVLTQCPDLIRLVLPKRWRECSSTHSSSNYWTRAELLGVFEELVKQTAFSRKFCIFVDGLDEYCGDHQEIIKLLQGFTQSEHIKICLSSRPWNVFLLAFGSGSYPKLHLEDLTQGDIELYVRDTLEENFLFQKLKQNEGHRSTELVDEVVYKARGVFLWVFLVIRSLVQGLTNADRITDLQRRLRQLPSDLETYFEHILVQVDTTYREQTGRIFQTALHAMEPLSLMTYVMLDEIEEDPMFALNLDIRPWNRLEIDSKCSDMRLRINARCKDLLEVTKVKQGETILSDVNIATSAPNSLSQTAARIDGNDSQMSSRRAFFTNSFFEYEVDFLHRTVRDFLQTKDMHDMLVSVVPASYNPHEALCHSFLAQIKTVPLKSEYIYRFGPLSDLIDDMMHYARELEVQTAVAPMELLDELERVYKSLVATLPASVAFSAPITIEVSLKDMRQSFLGFALQRGLRRYVIEKLHARVGGILDDVQLIIKALRPCLASKYALDSNFEPAEFIWKQLRMNEKTEVRTAVRAIMDQIRLHWFWDSNSPQYKKGQLRFIEILLHDGAESNGILSDLKWVDFILMASSSWRETDSEFTNTLSKVIGKFLESGILPNLLYRNDTLWGHFLKTIWGANIYEPKSIKNEWKQHAFSATQKFIDHGANCNHVVTGDLALGKYRKLEGLGVRDILVQIFLQEQVTILLSDR